MKDSMFSHPLMKPIKYRHKGFLQITGLDLKAHYFIEQLIEWTTLGHRYTEKQIEDLNQEELKWVSKGKHINKLHYEYLDISNRDDLLFHLSTKKGSILSLYMNLLQNQTDISDYVLQINMLLDKITLVYNQMNLDKNINLNYQIKPIQIKDINSTYLEPFVYLNQIHSLEFMNNDELFEEVLKILEFILKQSEKLFLLKINNLGNLLDEKKLNYVLNRLYNLSLCYQIDVINIAKNNYELLMNEDIVDSIIVCGDRVEQLDDYISIKDYVIRNYPKIYDDKENLLTRLQRVSPYLLSKKGSYYIGNHIDQIFFVLLNQGIGYFDYQYLKLDKINELEWNFLEDNLYKLI